ncbi:hypothetical protein D9758_007189 [Tetrapyrgos nigripes]|uniref:Dihydroorotate oxidase n=1 Tax=Tetrapyrgos nigripes TaxID=182062 RepID=A0A8H5D0U1_9AGAR|nr:hypothetical protein D9758_007189 [Tetrapyrgos nigripes]
MVLLNSISIAPPFLNSSCAWASDLDQLRELYQSPYTGAVTTRTSTPNGFKEDPSIHTVAFDENTSINSYGYSPYPLSQYLNLIKSILDERENPTKPFIVSITTSIPADLSVMLARIQDLRKSYPHLIAVELNSSCPNIPGSPPTAYVPSSLPPLLAVMSEAYLKDPTLTLGIKLPPYVYEDQFHQLLHVLKEYSYTTPDEKETNPFSFLTCTNTLGNSLLFEASAETGATPSFALPTPLGGLAGEAIHSLSLGNVYTFKKVLSTHASLSHIKIIGVGGVTTPQAARRMFEAGADAVACATLLGRMGVKAFEVISDGVAH